ncbi:Argininosuccinate lyase (plasmid) [Variovorax sp. SRS16]|uniref:Bug family tripartite tricarboxylate transporter substrate binding protein n=1 Tax=Variovorax sp. SRS16 TaxID=282217 RepID=UPI00131807BF|nr:tripartite tricarboxylate transporter substrate binding protein [Variovorax sp. SRS16]VTU46648.1 Argininosuccinate lyase [Variovorax sp. SRS16]
MKQCNRLVGIAAFIVACLQAPFAIAGDSIEAAGKPIEITVTFPPGGGTDVLARLIGNHTIDSLGRPSVIENRPGASGNLGARYVAARPADGASLLMVNSSFAINPGVFRTLPFNPKTDFVAIINVAYIATVMVVPADSPYKTFADVMAAARPKESKVSFGSCGSGTPQHLAGELINLRAGVHMQHVPYKGCGPALNDIVGGQVSIALVTASSAMPLIKSGKLRALAISSKERFSQLPDVPTVAEQGLPGYELSQWHGLLAPKGTPVEVQKRLYEGFAKILLRNDVQKVLNDLGYSPASDGPEAFQKIVNSDIDRFAEISKRIGLTAD